jgi:myotubularin-related protein 1/2
MAYRRITEMADGIGEEAMFLFQALGDSGWVMHIHSILAGSAWIAARIALQGASVLVHCSDGWDRTTQLVSLAGLLLDPYYRTFEGFQALVEKDWLAFGHPFADRLGMPTFNMNALSAESPAANATAISGPIFLQWVDCVAQILGMYPRAFEFSSAYLVEIVDCIFSGRFGNFLCNTENERQLAGVADSCGCMWVYLTQLRKSSGKSNIHEHCNIFYSPDEYSGPLLPPAAALAPTLWSRFHLRWVSPLEARTRSEIEAQCFMKIQREKEIAEDKIKDLVTNLESLTEQLVSEKRAHRSAVALATMAWRETMAIKRAAESVGYNVKISGFPDNVFTDTANSEDIEEKIMSMSQKELSEMKDVDEVKEREDEEDVMSQSVSVS